MPLIETVTIEDKTVTVRELTIREIYGADLTPPKEPELVPLYFALDMDYPLVIAAADVPAEYLAQLCPSDVDRVAEAFRKANPFLEKPLVKQSRERQREILVSSYSALFVTSLRRAMDQEPGTTQ